MKLANFLFPILTTNGLELKMKNILEDEKYR